MAEPELSPTVDWGGTIEAMNLAGGLCQAEARRMEAAHPPTAEHWRSIATRLHGGAMALAALTTSPPTPADPTTPPRITSDAVRITIEYADGSAEGADGPDAAAIWRHILGLFRLASVHGVDYTGPTLRPIRRAGGTGEDHP